MSKQFINVATGDSLLGRKGASGVQLKAKVLDYKTKDGKVKCKIDFNKDGKYDRILSLSAEEALESEFTDSEGITWFFQERTYTPPAKKAKEVVESDEMKKEAKKKAEKK